MYITDTTGFPVPTDRVDKLLQECGTTEQEVTDFIGPLFTQKKGFILNFLQTLSRQVAFYRERD